MRKLLLCVILLCGSAFAQGSFWKLPQPLPNAKVLVCPIQTANPCPSPSSIFSDSGLSVAVANPFNVGPTGNFGFWAASGQYTIYIGQPYNISFDITLGGGGGGGPITTSLTPENFGAIGNGVTNDCAAFTTGSASNTDLWLTSGHNYFISGTCTVSANIHYNNNSQFIIGPGATLNHNGQPIAGVQQIFTQQTTVNVADTMQRSNENPMSDGGAWVVGSYAGTGLTAEAGQLASNLYEQQTASATQVGYVLWNANGAVAANQISRVTLNASTASAVTCAVVRGNTSNAAQYRACEIAALGASGAVQLSKIASGGAVTNFISCSPPSGIFSGDTISLSATGTSTTVLNVLLNGAPMFTSSAMTALCTASDSSSPVTSGLPGMVVFGNGTIANSKISAWSGATLDTGVVTFGGAIASDFPEWFGAKGDLSTDDTNAIQQAINAFSTNGGGQVLFNPRGGSGYKITQTLVVRANGIWLVGLPTMGISMSSATANSLLFQGAAGALLNNDGVQNVNFVRTVSPASGASVGVMVNFVNLFHLLNVASYDSSTDFQQANSSGPIWYKDCVAAATLGTVTNGYKFIGANNSTRLLDSFALDLGATVADGLLLSGTATDFYAEGFEVNGGVTTGVLINGAGAENVRFVRPIMDVTFPFDIENSNAGALGADNDINITDCLCNAATTGSNAMTINNSTGVTVTGGTFNVPNSKIGIAITGGSKKFVINGAKIKFLGNSAGTATGISCSSSSDGVINNNSIGTVSTNGWLTEIAGATCTNTSITGNSLIDFATNGITLDATSNTNAVCANQVDTTHITNKITNSGTGNVCGLTN